MDGALSIDIASRVAHLTSLGHLSAVLSFALCSWLFYLAGLRRISQDRHELMRRQFHGLGTLTLLLLLAYALHSGLAAYRLLIPEVETLSVYTGLLSVFLAAALVVKTLKVSAFEYFFFTNMRVGVPLLLINVCSLILTLLVCSWILSSLFDIQLSSMLATSAVLSIILGLALQDTLGNLFAAISLQIDKPFELEDWIELKNGSEKITGQVKEMSWRATLLLAVTDELMTIPNRTLAQCQITNYSGRIRPFYRGYYFRFPFDTDLEMAQAILIECTRGIPEILSSPPPIAIVLETSESWVLVKVVYALKDFGKQYLVADKYHLAALRLLKERGIKLASNRLMVRSNFDHDS